ncbi:hypothetical protein KC336_g21396, partial [Hortaea werneckii]
MGSVERIRSLLDDIQASSFPDAEPGKVFTPSDPRLQKIFEDLSYLGLLRYLSQAKFRKRMAVLAEVSSTTQSEDKAGEHQSPFYPPYKFRRAGKAKIGEAVLGISCRRDEEQQGFQLWFGPRGPAGVQVPGPERGVYGPLPDPANRYSPHQSEARPNKAIENGNKATEKGSKTTVSDNANAE